MWSEKVIPLQNYKQYVLRILILLWSTTLYVCQTPGYPNITGSTFIVEGNPVTLSCTSYGGNPIPTVYWYQNNQLVDDTQTTTNGVTRNTYTFVADKSHNLGVFECQVDNNVLQNKLSTTWYFQVYTVPNQPSLTGSQSLSPGSTYVWTCISTGGNPAPTLILRIGNSQFSIGITQTSVLQSDKTYTVTSSLSWTPSISNNGQTLYCDVKHQETRGNILQTVSLQLTVTVAPSYIRILPACLVVNEGESFTLTCEADGDPPPTYKWYHNDVIIHEGAVLTITNSVWTEHDGLILCKATNTKGSRQTWEGVDVQHIPVSTVTQTNISQIVGSPVSLSCDTRANPSATTWEWFYNGNSLSSTSKALVVVLNSASEAGAYTCRAINGIGTSLDITFNIDIVSETVLGPVAAIVVDDSSRISTGEIVAIILAILFVLLLCLVVCCCCKGYFASLCGRKKEQVTPQVEHKRLEKYEYNKEADESIFYFHKLGIPKFYENPEPSVRKTRIKNYSVYRRHSDEFEISKTQIVKMENIKQFETTERSRDNTFVTPTGTCQQYYLPDIEYTYDEEEERRRRRRRRRKKTTPAHDEHNGDNKHSEPDRNIIVCKRDDEQKNDNKYNKPDRNISVCKTAPVTLAPASQPISTTCKTQVVKMEDIRQFETTERSRDNTFVTPTGTCQQYYLPDIEYTYDEEEERRRRRRRRSEKTTPAHDEQNGDNKHGEPDRNIIVCKRDDEQKDDNKYNNPDRNISVCKTAPETLAPEIQPILTS